VLAFWQLKNLSKLADSSNSKLVVPADFAGLMGAAKALLLATEPESASPAAAQDKVATGLAPARPPTPARPSVGRRTRTS
ncbi:MAG: hypothetical protein ACREOD_00685, partial [Candidatus Dormibacteria bacterium]